MNSRAWTEPATGAEARSLRRWARRAVLPRVLHAVVVFVLLVVAVDLYVNISAALLHDSICLGLCTEQPSNDLDWEPRDPLFF